VQLVAKLTSDLAFAEETAQEIWLAIWRGRSRYEGGDFRVYLLVAARNRCRNRARGSARQMPALRVLAHEPEPEAKGQLDALLAQERSEEMLRALAALRDADREALVLRFGAELDYDTMAQLTETKSGTLRARVHQGLAALRARLQKGGSR
jgi:RNA polymerase sigma-70 factor (ECF subfamily)